MSVTEVLVPLSVVVSERHVSSVPYMSRLDTYSEMGLSTDRLLGTD